jgi:hypothetical protein
MNTDSVQELCPYKIGKSAKWKGFQGQNRKIQFDAN